MNIGGNVSSITPMSFEKRFKIRPKIEVYDLNVIGNKKTNKILIYVPDGFLCKKSIVALVIELNI